MSHVQPAGWEVIPLGDVVSVASGIGFPLDEQGRTTGDLPFFKVADVSFAVRGSGGYLSHANHYVTHAVADRLRGIPVDVGATVFAKIGEAVRLNRRAIVTVPCLIDNNVMAVKACTPIVDRYVYQYLRTVDFSRTVRSTTVPSLRKGDIESLQFPLAPISEQQRIADKLDIVLARVDACRARLAHVASLLKRFRQSVLAAATSGRLTEDWRTSCKASAWTDTDIQSVAEVGTGSTPLRSNADYFAATGIPWITSGATSQPFVTSADEFVTTAAIRAHRLKVYPPGTLLVAMYGEGKTRGQVAELSIAATINQACAAVRVDEALARAAYVKLALQANYFEVRELAEGGNQPNLNLSKIKEFGLRLPSLGEQEEIIRRVETLFAFADRLEARLAQAQTAVDRLTPSLLAKAFRGELVPQDPADEPAAKLLKRLAVQRDAVLAKKASPTKMAAQAKKAAPAKKAARQKPGTNGPRHIAPVVEMLVPDNQPPTAKREPAPSSVGSQPLPDGEAVDAAVFCPPEVPRASRFMVQVYLYPPARSSEATALAKEADAGAERRGVLSLLLDLPRGTRVDLHLEMPTLKVEEADAQLIWRGATTGAQFEVEVPAGAADGTAMGRMRFSIAGVPAGTLRFQTSVASAVTTATSRQAEIWVKRYRRAFVSYSSEDRAEVLRRVQAFKIAGMSVFQDILDLGPGERWAKELYREIDGCDVFLLFWSKAAAESPWVGKEIDYAIARQKGDPEHPPEIQPVPIEGPPIPDRPASLQHLHFNDALLAHIAVA